MVDEKITAEHMEELRAAKHILENAGFAAKITDLVGTQVEKGIENLPKKWQENIVGISREALEKAADAAIWTINGGAPLPSKDVRHKVAVTATGALGGAFGLVALAVELPISTTIMLRSIADIARSEGEDLGSPKTKLACVEVFAFGGRTDSDDASESGYFMARAALVKVVTEAAEFLTKGGAKATTPAIVKFVTQVAARFQIQVSEKAAAQSVPAIGALGGALVNYVFMDHFQNMARGHFTVRRLERTYSPELIEAKYHDV